MSAVAVMRAGSVRTGPGTVTAPWSLSSCRLSRGERPATVTAMCCSCKSAAIVVPMAPGPMTTTFRVFTTEADYAGQDRVRLARASYRGCRICVASRSRSPE
jgi:hypothetical protein